MRLTKDEARILAQALNEYKYNVVNTFNDFKELGVFNKLHDNPIYRTLWRSPQCWNY